MSTLDASGPYSSQLRQLRRYFTPPADRPDYEVHGGTFSWRCHELSTGLLYLEKVRHIARSVIDAEVTGRFWSLVILPPDQRVSVARKGRLLSLGGPLGVLIPPLSIIEWHFSRGSVAWSSYMGRCDLPLECAQVPVCFPIESRRLPGSETGILELIRTSAPREPVGKTEVTSASAVRAKRLIDQTFDESLTLEEISGTLDLSHSVMSRTFRKCYGLPPVRYRNKLRVVEAMALMLYDGLSVAAASAQVGFEDFSRFNKNFLREMNAVPSCFQVTRRSRPRGK